MTKSFEIHFFLVLWSPDQIEMFVRLNDTDSDDRRILLWEKLNRDWTFWPFDQQFHLEIYLGVGGDVAGNEIDDDKFPQQLEIASVVLWSPDQIEMFVRLNDTDSYDRRILLWEKLNRDWTFWPFDQRFHLEIYLGVGGDVAGNEIDDDKFPQQLEIASVRFEEWNI
ncbi:unnamed protein product [Adineta steineri]|uniref:Uncharacterized protein n=1 Tax=Adineta steineri TaxID=433720 RepID=A0A815SA45_9BILA|nr:unnamed protein product [Adineta steineri]